MKLHADIRTAQVQAIKDALDAGGEAARLKVYTGDIPADGEITGQTLLLNYALSAPCGSVTDGVLTLGVIDEVNAQASGAPGFTRWESSDGDWVMDLPMGSGITLNSETVSAGQPVAVVGDRKIRAGGA